MLSKIAWKNITYKPLSSGLCICLILFGVGIISLLLLMQNQIEQKFDRDLKDIDVVVGAKGSPLQLVLSAVYHLDAPTGNIQLSEAQELMNSPIVDEAIPLAYGDSYMGYRILGTTENYLNKYDAELADGRVFSKSMEATLGAEIVEKFGLEIGDTFLGTHGDVEQGHVHEDHPYTVVGILKKTNTVLDRLVLTNIQSVWSVHAHEGHDHDHPPLDTIHALELDFDHNHDHHDHDHDHDHDHADDVITADSLEITAMLMKYKTKMSKLTMPRVINDQTNMQAVLPALEINRLFYMLGVGATTLKMIAGGIMLMAGFSVFFVLYSRLREREYELALMRSVGYRPRDLFGLLVLEGFLVAVIGYVLGWILSRIGLYFINRQAEHDYNMQFEMNWMPGEEWVFLVTLLVGVVAALIPAWRAMKMDVSTILSKS